MLAQLVRNLRNPFAGETTPPPIANFQFATRTKRTGNKSPRSGKDWLALAMGGCGYFEAAIVQIAEHYPISRGGWRTRCTCCTSRYDPRAQRCRVHDDGMTDRGRVRVADTGRVIGRPPGADHPRGATRVDLLARHNELTDRALLHRRQPRSRQCFCEGPRFASAASPPLLLLLRDSCRKIADSVESYSSERWTFCSSPSADLDSRHVGWGRRESSATDPSIFSSYIY